MEEVAARVRDVVQEALELFSADAMALFDDIVGQKLAVAMLTPGAGQRPLARLPVRRAARGGKDGDGRGIRRRLLTCDAGGCGDCSACRRVREGIHPDVSLLSPEGSASYLVDQIREINEHVSWRPYEAGRGCGS